MYEIYIEFLKKYNLYDKEVFDFIKDKTVYVDYMNTDSEDFIGVYPIVDEDNIVRDLRMCVPTIVDDISISMNIHEYVHLIKMYSNLNKEYVEDKYKELLPVMYELLFLKSINFNDYIDIYIEHIKKEDNYLKVLLDVFNLNSGNNITKK